MSASTYNWQQKGWPRFTYNRAHLSDELSAFADAFRKVKTALRTKQDPELVARTLTDEAVVTSRIEGVTVDESVVMSSICRALGVACAPTGFTKDLRAEGVAEMMLDVRACWNRPVTEALLKRFHKSLLKGGDGKIAAGAFRTHHEPMRVIRRLADGTVEIRDEAPPSEQVPREIRRFLSAWKECPVKAQDIALKAAFLHPHFESIHPFEDGNGRVGRALVAKVLSEGLGQPLVLPVSTVIARHRVAYYDEINAASRSLDWTNWAAFFIPVLTELLTDFLAAMNFVAAKRDYLTKYERHFSNRARKVILRMFEDGEEGVRSGLSAAKWMRMTKVSKPTATRELSELEKTGSIISVGAGPQTRYRLAVDLGEPIEPLNEPLNVRLVRLVQNHPGTQLPYLLSVVRESRATVRRVLSALIAEGKIEHRGSKKTGGYYIKQ